MNVEQIYEQTLSLSDEAREILIERMVQHMGQNIAPELERQHLDMVKARRAELLDGAVQGIDADRAVADVRHDLLK